MTVIINIETRYIYSLISLEIMRGQLNLSFKVTIDLFYFNDSVKIINAE